MIAATIFLWALKIWFALGMFFAVAFVIAGLTRVESDARGSSPALRLLLVPGCVIFWPWLGWRWIRRQDAPVECTYHRCAIGTED